MSDAEMVPVTDDDRKAANIGICTPAGILSGGLDDHPLVQALARHWLAAEAAAIERLGDAASALQWLSTRPTLELHHYMPVYGDDDDDAVEWRVTRVSGPINDREWTTVGQGETPLAAILDASLQEGASHVG